MSSGPVVFYFDFVSPYAFLAWTQIRAVAARAGRPLEPVPVLFAALLNAHGQKGPAEIPAKRRYLFKDIARKAHRFGVAAVTPPPAHPFNPLLALRISSLPSLSSEERVRIIDALFLAVWTKRQAIDAPDPVIAVLDAAGFDGRSLVQEGQTADAKDRVRAGTQRAIAHGIFGVPSIEADGELFWGTDSLADLESFLAGELPAFSDAGWDELPVGAVRTAKPA